MQYIHEAPRYVITTTAAVFSMYACNINFINNNIKINKPHVHPQVIPQVGCSRTWTFRSMNSAPF